MDQNEKEFHAQQHKDRVDLTIQHAKTWEKFQQRKEEYSQKYGASYANILLRQEKETLEAAFNLEIGDLGQQHDQQWLSYHENQSPDQPAFLEEAKPAKEQVAQGINAQPVHSMPDQSRRTLFANPFKQDAKEQNQTPNSPSKDIDQSQDYMKAMLDAQKVNPTKEGQTNKESVSMSERFSQGLKYNIAVDNSDGPIPNKPRERDKEMDRD